jgi:hypothetical protein
MSALEVSSGNLQYIVPAATAAIVSIAVVFLTRRSETKKHIESLTTASYVDFIRGVAGLAVLQKGRRGRPPDTEEDFLKGNELIMLVADAKARIALYGSKAVVSSLAQFLRAAVVLDSPERAKEFTAICQKMRNDSRPRPGKASDHDVHFLLFGFELENYLRGQNGGKPGDSK